MTLCLHPSLPGASCVDLCLELGHAGTLPSSAPGQMGVVPLTMGVV